MDDHSHNCGCHSHGGSELSQTLDELHFERSVCGAASRGDAERVKQLLENGRGHATDVDAYGDTPLHYVARSGHEDLCRLFLRRGALPNAATTSGKATPLHRAALQGHAGVCRLLLEAGADPLSRDADGQTPLHKVSEGGGGRCGDEI